MCDAIIPYSVKYKVALPCPATCAVTRVQGEQTHVRKDGGILFTEHVIMEVPSFTAFPTLRQHEIKHYASGKIEVVDVTGEHLFGR